MGEQIWSTSRHDIRPRTPVHLLPVGRPVRLAQDPAQPDDSMSPAVQRNGFHRRLKYALRACCAAANWVDHLPWVILGLRAAAREDDDTAPSQTVCCSPLILSGQFLDSPELPSKDFLEQLSKTLSAAKHPTTRHNTATACRPQPKLPDDLAPLYTPMPSFTAPCTPSCCALVTGRTR
jgi:hypothetical protein